MKKVMIILAAAFMFTACGNNSVETKQSTSDSTVVSDTTVVKDTTVGGGGGVSEVTDNGNGSGTGHNGATVEQK